MKSVVKVDNLYKSFGENHVLRDFSLTLNKGENLAIVGKSGSGKSVLIKCIINLVPADKGKIILLDQNVLEMEQDKLDELRAKVGFLFQSNALYDSMTVRENLEFSLRRHWNKEKREKEAEKAVLEVLDDVGLTHTLNMMPDELSGGMRKRIALARTLILRPNIIFYDEPTTGLDPVTSKEISQLINEVQHKYNASSIIISHDMSCIKITSNRVIMLIEGRCYLSDSFDNLQKSSDPKIQEFFN